MNKPTGYTVSWCCPECGSFENDKDTEGYVFDYMECSECDYKADLKPFPQTMEESDE